MKNASSSRFAALGMLTLEPMSGYEIKRRISESVAHFWAESYGQLYPTLAALASEGLVERRTESQAGRPERHIYSITGAGREALQDWLTAPPQRQRPRNELLLKLFFARSAPPEVALAHLEGMRRHSEQEVAQFSAIERELRKAPADDPDARFWLISLRYGLLRSQAAVDWAEESIAALRRSRGGKTRPAATPKKRAATKTTTLKRKRT